LRRRLAIRFWQFGQIAAGNSAELRADQVSRESSTQQTAVNSGDVALVERAANVSELSFQACADEFSLARFGEHRGERGVDVPVWHAARPQFPGNAEAALPTEIRVLPCEFEGVAAIVQIVQFAKASDYAIYGVFFRGAALQICTHFMNRMRAARKRAQRGGIEFLLGFELAGRKARAHEVSIVASTPGSKQPGTAVVCSQP